MSKLCIECKECKGKGFIAGAKTYYAHDGLWDTTVYRCFTCHGAGTATGLRQLQASLGVRINAKRKKWYTAGGGGDCSKK
jgi:hypothetical protein